MLISMKISRNSAFVGSGKPRMLFSPLINVKMPTITLMSSKISCSVELSMKKFYNLGARVYFVFLMKNEHFFLNENVNIIKIN